MLRTRPGRLRTAAGRDAIEGEVLLKVDEILDRMEHLVHHARHVPFSNQVMLDEDQVADLIDQIRFNLPDEIKQASQTMQEQQRLISEAHAEAGRIMGNANERAESSVQEHEIVHGAERDAQQTVRDARAKADRIIREAEAYTIEQLQQLEVHLSRTLATVKRGVEALQASQPQAAGPEDAKEHTSVR